MATNFNIEPYFDDYNEDDKYLRILFRPAYPVQARELTQSQTILQNQISRLANTMYKQGDKVSGSVSFYGSYAYVKLQNFYGTLDVSTNNSNDPTVINYIQNFVGKTIVGSVSNAQAIVLKATEATDTDPPTLYVSYNLTGTDDNDNKYDVFTENEKLTVLVEENTTATAYSVYTATQEATGFGTAVGITESVFYINDFFVNVDAQTIILSKYNEQVTAGDFIIGNRYQIRSLGTTDFTAYGAESNAVGIVFKATGVGIGTGVATIGPTYRVGLTVQEDFITPQDDPNLFDNAAGYSNYSAPGAHRYRIIAKLAKFPIDGTTGTDIDGNAAVDTGFVEVLRVNNGELAYAVKSNVNSDILEMMARRTFDESGNYTVRPFGIDVREHRNNYRGAWTKDTTYVIGDIVKNSAGNYYTARNSGISSSVEPTQAPPTFNSMSPTWNDNGGVGINWQYTDPNKILANDGIFSPENGGDESKLSIGIEAGKAYVEGYEITKVVTTRLPVDKSRTSGQVLEGSISTLVGNYVLLQNLTGLPNLSTYPQIDLLNKYDHVVGKARIRSVELSTGTAGSSTALYKASLFDVQMDQGITDIQITDPGSGYTVAPTTGNGGIILRDADNQDITIACGIDIQGIISGSALVALNIVDPGGSIDPTLPDVQIPVPADATIELTGNATAEIWPDTLEFSRVVKKIRYGSGPSAINAEIYKEYVSSPGYISFTGQSTTDGYKIVGENTILSLLRPGDTILVGLTSVSAQTSSASTQEMTIGYVESDNVAYVYYPSTTPTNTFVGFNSKSFKQQTSKINEPGKASLLFPLPYKSIKSIRAADDATIDAVLFVREIITSNTISYSSVGNTSSTIFTTTGGEFETPNSPYDADENYLVILSTNAIIKPTLIEFQGSSKNQVKISWSGNYAGYSAKLLATVIKSANSARESTKTLVPNAFNDRIQQLNATADIIQLDKADVYRIVRITQGASAWGEPYDNSTEIDITDNYTLDDGQRETHYDIASIIRKPTASIPTGPIRIWFEYFDHAAIGSTAGSYFSVNSYKSINYKDIPKYKGFSLADYIDFRPRRLQPVWRDTLSEPDPSITYADSGFGDVTYPVPSLPKRGYDMIASYSYYLDRRDIVYLDRAGVLSIATGTPASGNAAKFPDSTPANSMVLYNLSYSPYTPDASNTSVIVDTIDNRRYTMRDIGMLDKRISKLEEYTQLSFLERAAASTQINDPNVAFGADRLKAGFIVDQFDGHKIGDVTSIDYRISIDTIKQELRPLYNIENVNLVELATSDLQRRSKNYINYNDICMLPFTHKEFVKQPFASRTENVNPFAIFSFVGQILLTPDTDEWVDIENIDLPPVIDNSEMAALTNIANNTYNPVTGKMGILGNYYGAWQQVATGVSRTETSNYTTVVAGSWQYNANGTRGFRQNRHDEVTARQLQTVRPLYTGEVKLIGYSTPTLTADKVTSTSIIPYIRSRPVVFVGKGIKPDTDLMAFFDNINVNEYVVPAAKLTYTPSGTTLFDDVSPVGANSRETARTGVVDKNTATAYAKGDVVYVSARGGVTYSMESSPGTAVVAFSETRLDGGHKTMHIVNKKGGFLANDTIRGSVSGAIGNVYSQVTPTKLTTNKSGQVAGVFTIPNNTRTSFRSGSRMFRLSDKETIAVSTTRAEKTYVASGVKETHTRSFSSTAHYEIATRELGTESGGYTWVQDPTTRRTVADSGWYDPLAQTFLVQQEGGAMISKVDIYFQSKDANLPIRLEIRETDNGYPSKVIIPESVITLDPDSVNISEDASVATTFTFSSPVALKDKGEYALVLVSDSNAYKVWISKLGEEEVSTGRLIGEQPYAGVLFKSQNGSTWTAEQMEDMKFTIYRAQFATSVVANVDLINDINPRQQLKTNPFQFTAGSKDITVTQHNHGFYDGASTSYVTLSVPETSTYSGISGKYFNVKHKVQEVYDRNTYKITLTTASDGTSAPNASNSVLDGGNDEIFATRNIQYNELYPSVNELLMPNTYIDYEIQAVSGKSSTDSSDVPYQFDEGFVDVIVGQNNFFQTPRLVASAENELAGMSGKHSVTLRAKMYTTNDAVSPFLDLKRTSALVVENIIDTGNANSPFYVDESEPHTGSATAKYLTKKVTLESPATGLYVSYNANIPPAASISVYYRVGKASEDYLFDLRPWLVALNEDIFLDTYKTDDPKAFPQVQYTIDKTEGEYDVVQVKLVMRSTSSSAVPRVKDFTVIALA